MVFRPLDTAEREGVVRLTGGAVVEAVEHPKLPRLFDIRPIRPLPPVVMDRPPLLRLPQQLARHARRAQHAAHYVRAAVSLLPFFVRHAIVGDEGMAGGGGGLGGRQADSNTQKRRYICVRR